MKRSPATRTAANGESASGFTAEERDAMRERARELKVARASARGGKADDERAVVEKIAAMPDSDRTMGERLHAIIKTSADEGQMWPTAFAVGKLGAVEEAKIVALVKKAAS